MADLTQVVTDLKAAIDGAVGRLQDKIDVLTSANADLSNALAVAQLDDAAAAAALAASNQAAADLQTEISDLAGVGNDVVVDPPVDPPVEPPVEPVPVDPNAPVDPNQPV